MRLQEVAVAEGQINLWKLIRDSVWKAISVQAHEQEQVAQQAQQNQKKMPKTSQPQSSAPKPPKVSFKGSVRSRRASCLAGCAAHKYKWRHYAKQTNPTPH